MAKKIVRGITDVKTINNQDYDTNNVNDLLSDGQYNYIHRKKGKIEEYHNLTDNIKTISSDNTELLAVTNNNKTTNTATLHPKHDNQKEQVLESTRDTITINHGTNGTDEKTTVDVNFEKVQEKLTAGTGITIQGQTISANGATSSIKKYDYPTGDDTFHALRHDVSKVDSYGDETVTVTSTITTFSFECFSTTAEYVLTGELKEELEELVTPNHSISNGAITISNDGTTMKLINSAPSRDVDQQGTFTFYTNYDGGGVPGPAPY